MARKTPIDRLAATIQKTLDQYGEDVFGLTEEAVKKVTRAGVTAVKQGAQQAVNTKPSSDYLKGWTSKLETGRTSAQGIIYNKLVPGLPHLLEHGHVSRNGTGRTFGRVPAYPHIGPVEAKIAEQLENTIRRELE